MSNPAKAKGDEAERIAARVLSDVTGYTVRRKLGAGRTDDEGDLDGIPDTVIQVASWKDTLRAVWEKPFGAETQRINAGAGYAATLVWLPRRGFRVVMTPEQFAAYVQATTEGKP
jgi:hypothetical protein